MTAAQRTTGAHRRSAAECRHVPDGRLGATQRSTVREPGASPGRSRRCEGRRPTRKRHWPQGREGREGGAPSQKTCRAPQPRTPRGRRIRASQAHCSLGASRTRSDAGRARGERQDPGRRQDDHDLRRRAADGDRRQRAPGARRRQHRRRVLLRRRRRRRSATTSARSASTRPVGSAGWVFKVNGVSPPVGADKVTLKDGDVVLWYYATFGADRRAADARAEAAARPTATSSSRSPTPASARGPRPRRSSPTASGSGPTAGRACIGRHAGLVRATAPGAVRSNAVK